MIQNPRYIGDSFYPAIITSETARKLEDERKRREKVLGRDKLKKTAGLISRILMPTRFGVNEMFPLTSKMNDKVPLTQDINSGVSGHIETVALLSRK